MLIRLTAFIGSSVKDVRKVLQNNVYSLMEMNKMNIGKVQGDCTLEMSSKWCKWL